MFKIFKRDNFIIGIALGIFLPLASYGILYSLNMYIATLHQGVPFIKNSTLQLICIFLNLFILRHYLVKAKYDRTGRGILLVTFIFAGVYFYFNL